MTEAHAAHKIVVFFTRLLPLPAFFTLSLSLSLVGYLFILLILFAQDRDFTVNAP
jgi:hypothetical protein